MKKELDIDSAEYIRTDHHAVLMFDELEALTQLFDRGAASLDFDVRGGKTLKRTNDTIDRGIKIVTHKFVEVNLRDCVANNAGDIRKLSKKLADAGAPNCYITRVLVNWGDLRAPDQWQSQAIPMVSRELDRVYKTQRGNVLTIVRPTVDEARAYAEWYGDLTKPTDCLIFQEAGLLRSTCAGTLPSI